MGETVVDEPIEVRFESLGMKRLLEDDIKSDLANKKARIVRGEIRSRVNLKKVAEIVIVLATIGKLRAGRNPTPVEIKMIADAREKLAEICKEFAPKDVFPKDAFGMIMKDLGLNRLGETKLGICPPKMSIAEKLQHTKQKMEKSEVFQLHSATYKPSVTQPRETMHSVRVFPSGKADHAPVLSAGLQHHSTVVHASLVSNSRSLPYQLPPSEVRPERSSDLSSSRLGRDCTESPVQQPGGPQLRSDERFTAISTGDHRAPITQKEVSKFVEKILQPQITEHRKWTPPSRDYMNKPLTCETCKTTITEVGTTLICDACEKGYHLKCLHYVPKSFSADKWQAWHCVKCLSTTNGKPLPPTFGPVMKNINTSKKSSINGTHECSPKDNIVRTSESCNDVEWVGGVVNEIDGRTNYSSCCINGTIYQLQDYASFTSNGSNIMPNKLQAMWEDNKTSEKWITVTHCFFPEDLPEGVGRPCAPECNEVYESNHETVLAARLIHGPCAVLPPHKFTEEKEMQTRSSDKPKPLFLCKWFYDEKKRLFRDVTSKEY